MKLCGVIIPLFLNPTDVSELPISMLQESVPPNLKSDSLILSGAPDRTNLSLVTAGLRSTIDEFRRGDTRLFLEESREMVRKLEA